MTENRKPTFHKGQVIEAEGHTLTFLVDAYPGDPVVTGTLLFDGNPSVGDTRFPPWAARILMRGRE